MAIGGVSATSLRRRFTSSVSFHLVASSSSFSSTPLAIFVFHWVFFLPLLHQRLLLFPTFSSSPSSSSSSSSSSFFCVSLFFFCRLCLRLWHGCQPTSCICFISLSAFLLACAFITFLLRRLFRSAGTGNVLRITSENHKLRAAAEGCLLRRVDSFILFPYHGPCVCVCVCVCAYVCVCECVVIYDQPSQRLSNSIRAPGIRPAAFFFSLSLSLPLPSLIRFVFLVESILSRVFLSAITLTVLSIRIWFF